MPRWLRALITVALLVALASRLDWAEFAATAASVSLVPALGALVAAQFAMVVSAYKWTILSRPFDPGFPFPRAARIYYAGAFFGNFLPGSIGGDGYRAYKAYERLPDKTVAIVPILAERLSGLFFLAAAGAATASWQYSWRGDAMSGTAAAIGAAAATGALLPLLVMRHRTRLLGLLPPLRFGRLRAAALKVSDTVLRYGRGARLPLAVTLVTAIFYAFLLCGFFLLLRAAGADVGLADLLVAIMLSNLVAMLPLSINGYGLLDLSFVYLLHNFGASYEDAVLVMALQRGVLLFTSSLGGLFLLAPSGLSLGGRPRV